MTVENYQYRTSPFLLRNQFTGEGKFKIPRVPKFQAEEGDFEGLRLIGFDKTKLEDQTCLDRMVHFFLYDYKFERVWKNPDTDIEKLKRYRGVLSPDFSMYTDMAPVMQLYNTFRNRWCGAYFASKGMRVIPTVSWGNETTFEFCFDGIEKGSVVAVSTYMVSAHNNHSDQKEFFMKGYNELLRRIEPEKIICYNEPFPEMRGDIVFVDYTLSSWRYMNDEPYIPSKYAKYICGVEPLPIQTNLVVKTGYITRDMGYFEKGMGSSSGGEWRPSPNKPNDKRFLGKPGEIKRTKMSDGSIYETKIGEDGKAVKERHNTNHCRAHTGHKKQHDHEIDGDNGYPHLGPAINYPDDQVPEFKNFMEVSKRMNEKILIINNEDLKFESISDFKWCMKCGGEVQFVYNGRSYSITQPNGIIDIGEGYYMMDGVAYNVKSKERCVDFLGKQYETADEALEYVIDGVRLRDIITEVEVWERTI